MRVTRGQMIRLAVATLFWGAATIWLDGYAEEERTAIAAFLGWIAAAGTFATLKASGPSSERKRVWIVMGSWAAILIAFSWLELYAHAGIFAFSGAAGLMVLDVVIRMGRVGES